MKSNSYNYRLGLSTVSNIINVTSSGIWDCLHEDYLPIPTEESWKNIAEQFEMKWQFPNCVGAIDGKHIRIQVKYYKFFLKSTLLIIVSGSSTYWIR